MTRLQHQYIRGFLCEETQYARFAKVREELRERPANVSTATHSNLAASGMILDGPGYDTWREQA